MTFQWEATPLRQEVRYGTNTSRIIYWPKPAGLNVELNVSPATGEHGTYQVFGPGNELLASGTSSYATPVATGQTFLYATVDARDTVAYRLLEGYRVEWTWSYAGTPYVDSTYFDVVRQPWLTPLSLNDLQAEVADLDRLLERHGVQTSTTAAQAAARYGVLAWGDVSGLVRTAAAGLGYELPRCLVDREAVRGVAAAFAVARAYRANGGGAGSESALLAEEWTAIAQARFRAMGPLRADLNQDGAADTTLTGWSSVSMSRVW